MAVTDTICVALRKAGVMKMGANRVKLYREMLGFTEREAKRLDWFVNKLGMSQSGVPLLDVAIAAAWLANEAFYVDDGVNDWPYSWCWDGQGGGDFRTDPENPNKWVPVEKNQ